jgi:hypothetical protein
MQIDKTNRKEKSLGDSKRSQNEELEKVNKKIPKKKMMLNLLLSNFFCFITKSLLSAGVSQATHSRLCLLL